MLPNNELSLKVATMMQSPDSFKHSPSRSKSGFRTADVEKSREKSLRGFDQTVDRKLSAMNKLLMEEMIDCRNRCLNLFVRMGTCANNCILHELLMQAVILCNSSAFSERRRNCKRVYNLIKLFGFFFYSNRKKSRFHSFVS